MRYSVCIIDNDLPAGGELAQQSGINDTQLLNASNLRLLFDKATWTDAVVKNLAGSLLNETAADGLTPKWEVFGFTNPAFFINQINGGLFRSDIIIFDWDYPGMQAGMGTDSESLLRDILQKTFCLVFIFSRADKKDEILGILEKKDFAGFKGRVEYLDKEVQGTDQTNILLAKAQEMYDGNFSFKFASVLRRKSLQSMDSILSDMGKASLNDIKNHVAGGEAGKKDFVDFLAERYRATVAGADIYDLVDQIPEPVGGAAPLNEAIAATVWSNRLYFQRDNGDDLIRRGDIVKKGESYYLILSADCDLGKFWKKNLGIINAVVLHPLEASNAELRDLLTVCAKPQELSKGRFSSLLAKIGELSEGPFVLPFVMFPDGLKHFVAIPKELFSQRINLPAAHAELTTKARGGEPVRYPHWQGADRVCTISEPFLTPVVQHVLDALGGFGVPDYPDHMNQILLKVVSDFGTPPAVGAGPAGPAILAPLAAAPPSAAPPSAAVVTPSDAAPIATEPQQGDKKA